MRTLTRTRRAICFKSVSVLELICDLISVGKRTTAAYFPQNCVERSRET
jgi:hypothetical protein